MHYIFSTPLFYSSSFSFTPFLSWLAPLLFWSLIWKGIALWKAARNHHLYWYLALLILNTAGILEIIYLAFFQNKSGPQYFGCGCETEPKIKVKKRRQSK